MRSLLKIILALRGCRHRWEVIKTIDIMSERYKHPVGNKYVLRCTRCGDMAQRKLMS